ncbi:hypothetical protein ACOSP7_021783 [Xanthoceras sorbifolium]
MACHRGGFGAQIGGRASDKAKVLSLTPMCCFSSLSPSASSCMFCFTVFSLFEDLGRQRFDLGLEIIDGRISIRDGDTVEIVEMVLNNGQSEVRFGLVFISWYERSWKDDTSFQKYIITELLLSTSTFKEMLCILCNSF